MRSNKQIIIGAVGGLITGLLLHLIAPAALGALLAGGASGLTILDPLYAGDRVGEIWNVFGVFLAVQTALAVIVATISGGLVGLMGKRWQSGWIFLTGPIASLVVHGLGAIIILLITELLARESVGLILATSIIIILTVAPIVGLISAILVRIFAGKDNQLEQ